MPPIGITSGTDAIARVVHHRDVRECTPDINPNPPSHGIVPLPVHPPSLAKSKHVANLLRDILGENCAFFVTLSRRVMLPEAVIS